jgi:hypothetical protein
MTQLGHDMKRESPAHVLRQGKQMGTRSTIGIKSQDGTVKAIYCHWDGYPAGVGLGLIDNYNSKEQAEALIALGGFSSLMETLEETKAGAYGNDSDKARTFTGVQDWLDNFNSGEEYAYLYEDGKGWIYFSDEAFDEYMPLILKREESVA